MSITTSEVNSTTNLTNWDGEMEPGKAESSQHDEGNVLNEAERLKMLGYDAALGRPLGLWSATAMNFCHLSFQFEYIMYISQYSYNGPLLFVIGYPFAAIFNIILLGPFCEMVSAFPVAGAMASWSWQCARKGVRHERQWGYLMGGIVLTMHIGKVLLLFHGITVSLTTMYVNFSGIPANVLTGEALDPQKWWNPVFYLTLVTFAAIIAMTRVGRNGNFWITCAIFNLCILVMIVTVYVMCGVKTRNMPRNLGFQKGKWTHSFAWMVFMGLPLRPPTIDCAAHMAEETRNPSRNVPRAMYLSTIAHHCIVYFLVTAFTMFVMPGAYSIMAVSSAAVSAPIIPIAIILGLNRSTTMAFAILSYISGITYVLAAMTVSSRFLFALARDHGIPFAKILAKTDKHKEPWVASLAIVLTMYLGTLAWFVNEANWYNLLLASGFWLIDIAYIIPLVLYVTSKINFRQVQRSEFSLHGWGKPSAYLSLAYLILPTIQGCMPISMWVNVQASFLATDTISAFPMFIAGLFLLILVCWWLYGRRHYIGPIRSITKWTAGVEIDPHNLEGSAIRHTALNSYINKQTGSRKGILPIPTLGSGPSSGPQSGPSSPTPPKRGRGMSSSGDSDAPMLSPAGIKRFLGLGSPKEKNFNPAETSRSGSGTGGTPQSHLAGPTLGLGESQVMPSMLMFSSPAQQESQLLPYQTQTWSMNDAQIESQLLPQLTQVGSLNAAQVESQLMPPQDAASPRRSRASLLSRITAFQTVEEAQEEESFTMGQLSSSSRGHDNSHNSLANSNGQRSLTSSSNHHSQYASQHSSQHVWHNEPPALQESQIDHSFYNQSQFEPSAMQESQLEPSHGLASMFEPMAMQESQLEPAAVDSIFEPAAM